MATTRETYQSLYDQQLGPLRKSDPRSYFAILRGAASLLVPSPHRPGTQATENFLSFLGSVRPAAPEDIRVLRLKRRAAKAPRTYRFPLAERLQQSRIRKLSAALSTWGTDIRISAGNAPSVVYHQEAEWDRPYKRGRRNWPSRRWDSLRISLPDRTPWGYDHKSRTLIIGRWQWRRARGHSLAVRYLGAAGTAWTDYQAQTNIEMRQAILQAHPALLEDAGAKLIQQDEYGQLFCFAAGIATDYRPIQIVRVTCPSTGRVYALQCAPTCKTAHEAVAQSFGLPAGAYSPAYEG